MYNGLHKVKNKYYNQRRNSGLSEGKHTIVKFILHVFNVSVRSCYHFVSCPAGDGAERGEGEQRGSERSSERADREAALPADPGGGAGGSAQTGEL